jgi:bifunctional UDP-N-acetylglucosamine pyrophosphorylase/glucosamine-1-phosphate N-acetyltransferase
MQPIDSLILAAGLGTRMKSEKPKVLHTLAGKPMLTWVVDACSLATGRPPYVVVGPGQEEVEAAITGTSGYVIQRERLGTGHAVMQAVEQLKGNSEVVLVVNADLPLLRAKTLANLVKTHKQSDAQVTLLTSSSLQARGFGRIERGETGEIERIIEERDASPDQLDNLELNVGAYCYNGDWLWTHLENLNTAESGEYYLTDLAQVASEEGGKVNSIKVTDQDEIIGINTRVHLAEAEYAIRHRINRHWMLEGVTLVDPATTYIDADVKLNRDVVILPNTHLKGQTVVGIGTLIGPNSFIESSSIGTQCHVQNSFLESAEVGDEVEIGPFARIRPGTRLGNGVHIGNFGELKNSDLAEGVKVGHFSYLGDATIEAEVNIGAGTITCNFDGRSKHPTHIEAGAFIGSDTMLVAPVKIGKGARTGAGSVVTKDVPDHTLAAGVPARSIRKLKKDE